MTSSSTSTVLYTFAETRERLLAALDANPSFAQNPESCTYFHPRHGYALEPDPSFIPACAVGQAFADILRPIISSESPLVNGAGIGALINEFLPGQFAEEAYLLLEFAQDMNDEGTPWREIAASIREDYPA